MEDHNSLKANQIGGLLSDLEKADDMDIALHMGLLRELYSKLDRHLPGPVSWIKMLGSWLTTASDEDIVFEAPRATICGLVEVHPA